jgi:hypothetical protein
LSTRSDHVARTCRSLDRLGFHLACPEEIALGRMAAAELVGEAIASVETLLRIQARTACSVFVATDAAGHLTAAVSGLPLTSAALAALESGGFDGVSPPDAMVARPVEPVAALYLWGAAGLTWRGRTLALAASVALQREVYPDLPCYARAATGDGERALEHRMGARPIAGGLVLAPPWIPRTKAA